MGIFSKRKLTAAQIAEKIERFDSETAALKSSLAEAKKELANALALEEDEGQSAVEKARREVEKFASALSNRDLARRVLETELEDAGEREAAQADEERLSRARRWLDEYGKKGRRVAAAIRELGVALDDLVKQPGHVPSVFTTSESDVEREMMWSTIRAEGVLLKLSDSFSRLHVHPGLKGGVILNRKSLEQAAVSAESIEKTLSVYLNKQA